MMKEKQYFLSLVSHAEGYLPTIHRDNVGYALGMGWNLTKQSKEFNASIAQALYLSDNEIDKLAKVSNKNHGQINEKSYDGIKLLPHRAIQASQKLRRHQEKSPSSCSANAPWKGPFRFGSIASVHHHYPYV